MIWDIFSEVALFPSSSVFWSLKLKLELIIKEDNRLPAIHCKGILSLESVFLPGPK